VYKRQACSYAKSIGEKYDAEIILLHVIKDELPGLLIFDAGMDRTSKEVASRLSMQKELFEEQKAQIISKIREEYGTETGVKKIIVERGHPVKLILKVAESEACDLIVMGVKGRGYLEDFLMGDTVRHVITSSKVPVLVVQNKI
jgi:nucleotide-binding universal stress UspA family protein